MLNNIFLNNLKIIKKEKNGRFVYFELDDGTRVCSKDLNKKTISIQCHICNDFREVKFYQGKNGLLNRTYICSKCHSLGERNGFYGKKHSDEVKEKISKSKKGKQTGKNNPMYGRCIWREMSPEAIQNAKNKLKISCSGERNGFYGKTHSDETIKIIREKNKKYIESLTDEDKKIISEKLSNAQKELLKKDPISYRSNKIKAAYESAKVNKRYKMNKVEMAVNDQLLKRNLNFDYSVILNFHQFDFGCKKYKILLEVNGDYWHGNPIFYGDEEGKKKLNNIQNIKINKDKEKEKFAKEHNLNLFIIWENDINNNNFSVIDEIERLIKNAV